MKREVVTTEEINNCSNCKHAKFDNIWGEYKCLKHGYRVYAVINADACPDYEKQKVRDIVEEKE